MTSGVSHRPLTAILLRSIAMHFPFLLRHFCSCIHALLSVGSSAYTTDVYHDAATIGTRYFRRSVGVVLRCWLPSLRVRNPAGATP